MEYPTLDLAELPRVNRRRLLIAFQSKDSYLEKDKRAVNAIQIVVFNKIFILFSRGSRNMTTIGDDWGKAFPLGG